MNKLTAKKEVTVTENFCKACGYCIQTCPDNVLTYKKKYNSSGYHPVQLTGPCRLCGFCYMVCPDNAIQLKLKKNV